MLTWGINIVLNNLTSMNPLEGGPTKLVLTAPSQSDGIQLIEERSKEFHLSIMHHSYKLTFQCVEPLKN